MILNPQQEQAMQLIRMFTNDSRCSVFVLRGYAGTGKTTMIQAIVEYLKGLLLDVRLMAPTGRAAKVLRSKMNNSDATTIHRAIYSFDRVYCNTMTDSVKYIFPLKTEEQEQKEQERKEEYQSDTAKASLISRKSVYIIDEASMIATGMSGGGMFQYGTGFLMDDILEKAHVGNGGKIIFVGDPMQLPPVGEEDSLALDADYFRSRGLKTMDFELTEVIRQEKDSMILQNAMMCRNAISGPGIGRLWYTRREDEVVDIDAQAVAETYCQMPLGSAAIVCWSNRQAAQYNSTIRGILHPRTAGVCVGDRLMAVSNNYLNNDDIMNGDMLTVTSIDGASETVVTPIWANNGETEAMTDVILRFRRVGLRTEDGRHTSRYIIESLLDNDQPSLSADEKRALYIGMVNRVRECTGISDTTSPYFIEAVMADEYYNALQVKYGYAFTCHKAQGGEWDNVFVDLNGRTGLDPETLRWNYTALTRARKTLYIINGKLESPFTGLIIHPTRKMSKRPKNTAPASAYEPSVRSLSELTELMTQASIKAQATITGICEGQYRVTYYLQTSGKHSNIAFTFDKTGRITTATPASDLIDDDEKLNDIISALMDYVMDNTTI